jgi:hypothetical protein
MAALWQVLSSLFGLLKSLSLARILSVALVVASAFLAPPAKNVEKAGLSHNYPRLANYFLKPNLSEDRIDGLRKWDVLVLSSELGYNNPSGLDAIRSRNPNALFLAYVDTMLVARRGAYGYDWRYNYFKLLAAESSGSPGWWLRDQYGNQISTWTDVWNLNLSDVGPIHDGKRWPEFLADLVRKEMLRDYSWDGVLYDDAHQYASFLNNGNLDLNNDRIQDSPSYVRKHWASGLKTLFSRSRANGQDRIIIGNGGYTLYAHGNGRLFEPFPSGTTWDKSMKEYLIWLSVGAQPRLSIINGNNGNAGDQFYSLQNMRFTMTSALMGDGYFSYDYGGTSHGQLWWYDEYSVDASGNATGDDSGKGYLGQPLRGARKLGNGVWRRDFDRGIVLVNPTSQTQTVKLEKKYRKILGTQAPDVNDGSLMDEVSLPSQDGIILLVQGRKTARSSSSSYR